MTPAEATKKTVRALGIAAAIVGAVSITGVPGAAYAQHWHGGGWHGGGISTGAAVGLGLGAFALGGALGAAAARPYYGYSYPYYGYSYPYYGTGYGAYSYPYYGGAYAAYPYYGGGYAYPYNYGYGY